MDNLIIKKVGSGTLGDTYLAQHRFIKKNFILKILPQDLEK